MWLSPLPQWGEKGGIVKSVAMTKSTVIFTYYIEPHGKSALPGSVPGHTLVHTSMMHRHNLYDEWVHPFLTHQHLMVVIWTNGFTVQIPGDIGCWEASHLKLTHFHDSSLVKNSLLNLILCGFQYMKPSVLREPPWSQSYRSAPPPPWGLEGPAGSEARNISPG